MLTSNNKEESAMSEPIAKSAEAEPVLLREDAGGVAWLTLNRPKQRNSLSTDLMLALTREIEAIGTDPSVHVVVLAGNGPAFCARSEEHTSELQSREKLVCRLLLEKKKTWTAT